MGVAAGEEASEANAAASRTGPSSLRIVPVALPVVFATVAFRGEERRTRKVSFASAIRSPITGTVIKRRICPGANVTLPAVAR